MVCSLHGLRLYMPAFIRDQGLVLQMTMAFESFSG